MDILILISLFAFALASYTDIRFKKVQNRLVFLLIGIGLLYHFSYGGIKGIGFALFGMAIPFIALYLFFMIGTIGAGDVKLLMGIGTLCGLKVITSTLAYGLICNAILALVVLLMRKDGQRRIRNMGLYLWNLVLLKKFIYYSEDTEHNQLVKLPLVPMFFLGHLVGLFRPIL